ncbi:hypothetical protein AADEFJLK_02693 [Methylovulum psychrotolerans]|uniref:Uncharacterized protein n=1 Tax=Methylovulum psychrotolerans TaxID=1704499 RepID=A0A2S5CKF8_9GAMM|nr:hypothetical protein AADEFJLK_02693 [Methylovulum psychrotolerans]
MRGVIGLGGVKGVQQLPPFRVRQDAELADRASRVVGQRGGQAVYSRLQIPGDAPRIDAVGALGGEQEAVAQVVYADRDGVVGAFFATHYL